MNSIKWKCENWMVYYKKLDKFYLFNSIGEKVDVFNFHPIFSIVMTNVIFMCEI